MKRLLWLIFLLALGSPAHAQITGSGPGGAAGAGGQAVNELGTITNGGTATCNFGGAYTCHFTLASPDNAVTIGDPTNLPTNAIVNIGFSQAAAGFPSETWGTTANVFFALGNNSVTTVTMNGNTNFNFAMYTNSTSGTAWASFWSNGTTLTLLPGSVIRPDFDVVTANTANVNGNVSALQGGPFSATGGSVPTCSGGSGTCVTVTGSTNNRGQIHLTGGTAVTAITLTFNSSRAFPQAPFCNFTSGTAVVAGLFSPTGACGAAATCVVGLTSTTAADINYSCW